MAPLTGRSAPATSDVIYRAVKCDRSAPAGAPVDDLQPRCRVHEDEPEWL